jgi:hypothetical protein
MRRIILATVITFITTHAFAYGTVLCHSIATGIDCVTVENALRASDSAIAANQACKARYPTAGEDFCNISSSVIWQHFQNACVAVFTNSQRQPFLAVEQTALNATATALTRCVSSSRQAGVDCTRAALACDGNGIPLISPAPATTAQPAPVPAPRLSSVPTPSLNAISFVDNSTLVTLLTILIPFFSFLLVLVAFILLMDPLIHGSLPKSLSAYGEDIQVLFKHSQRVNWYGRVVFGLTARLGTTEKQLGLVRRYWLGRVVAFDSLRRQRQNELARLHVQLAMQAKSDPHDKKKFWSRRWATFRSFVKKLFWVFLALFRLLLSFFFIRVTIAKLVRGTLVESKDLVLLMQAKEAIQESALYLKQYLVLAETFHGQEELFEPE